jgi:hypothetical protein
MGAAIGAVLGAALPGLFFAQVGQGVARVPTVRPAGQVQLLAAKVKKPGKPGTPKVRVTGESHVVFVAWKAAKANGAKVGKYQVKDSKGRATTCTATSCGITGLTNGVSLKFKVRAHNRKGWGGWSGWSKAATPNTAPGAPASVTVTSPQDGSVLVSWGAIPNEGSPIQKMVISWPGTSVTTTTTARSYRVTGLSNTTVYTFTVAAANSYGTGPTASATGQSSGKPLGLSVAAPQPGSTSGASTSVAIAWTLQSANGPGPVTYAVTRNDGKQICTGVTVTTCTDAPVNLDGTTYTYTVVASNATPGAAHTTTATSSSWNASPYSIVISQSPTLAPMNGSCTYRGAGCPYVAITTVGMTGTINCAVFDSGQGQWDSHAFAAPLTNKLYWYYGYVGRSVWVVCNGVESNHVNW